jgi:hypothetical protein
MCFNSLQYPLDFLTYPFEPDKWLRATQNSQQCSHIELVLAREILVAIKMRRDPPQVPTSFLQKTFDILCNPDLDNIISWNHSGTLFLVKNVTDFCDQVLPVYFKHSNYASFVRQLNMYDFHKVREGTWDNAFKHPLFLRGKPELLTEIRRKTAENREMGSIVPVNILNRTECDDIMQKLYTLQRKQHQMELQMQSLEDRNTEILEYNKSLFRELCYYKDREQKLEHMLMVFSSYVQSPRAKEGDELTDLISSIGLPQRPAMLMNQANLSEAKPDLEEDVPFKRTKVSEADEVEMQAEEFTVPEDELDRLLGSPS